MRRTYLFAAALFVVTLSPALGRAAAATPKVTHDGVGPIDKHTALGSNKKLHKMFKGCDVSTSTKMLDHKPTEKVVEVTCHGQPTYTLRSANNLDSILSAEAQRPGTRSPEGVAVGMTMADVYKLGQVDCDADVNPSVVRCVFLGDTTVAYSAKDTTKEANGLLPPEEQIKRLKITSIIWRANMM